MSTEPRESLREPSGADPIPDLLENALGLSLISPAFYIQEFCKNVLHKDPWAWASEEVSGDWAAVARGAASVRNLATFNLEYANAIEEGLSEAATWSGAADTAARSYFESLAGAIDRQAAPMRQIADQLEDLSTAMYELGQFVSATLSTIADLAAMALIEIAAAQAAALSGVGLFATAAMMGAATLQITTMINKWSTAIDVWTTTWTLVQGLMAGIVGSAATIRDITIPGLPEVKV